jgi:hypothetical protein
VVSLLKELTKRRLRNVCLQSGKASLVRELEYRKPLSMIWLSEEDGSEAADPGLWASILRNSSVLLTPNRGRPEVHAEEYRILIEEVDSANSDYSVYARANR